MPKCVICGEKFKYRYNTFEKTCGFGCREKWDGKVKDSILKPKPRKPIAKFSKKRNEQRKEYNALREKFLKENPVCQVKSGVCTYESTSVHHRHGGADRAKHYLDVSTFLACCVPCHSYLEVNVSWSKGKGFIL